MRRRSREQELMLETSAGGRRGPLVAIMLAAAVVLGTSAAARAQQVVAFVNGAPITTLDVEHRAKFMQLSTKKVPARKEVLDSLINEILELNEAKRFGIEIPRSGSGQGFRRGRAPHGRRRAEAHAGIDRCWRKRRHLQAASAGAAGLEHARARALQGEPRNPRQGRRSAARAAQERQEGRCRLRVHHVTRGLHRAARYPGCRVRGAQARRRHPARALSELQRRHSVSPAARSPAVAVRDQGLGSSQPTLPQQLRGPHPRQHRRQAI